MNRNISRLVPDASMTVGDLITELCRWPDHAIIKFRCPEHSAALSFSRVASHSKGVVDIELHPAPETAPIVPA